MKRKNIKLYVLMLIASSLLGMSGCTFSVTIERKTDTSKQEDTDIPETTLDETETNKREKDAQPSEKAKETEQKADKSDINNENEGQKLVKNISADLNVRKYPRHKSDLVGVVSNGQLMYFYGETGQGYGSDEIIHDWYRIYLENGITGWVRSDLVTEVDSEDNLDQ